VGVEDWVAVAGETGFGGVGGGEAEVVPGGFAGGLGGGGDSGLGEEAVGDGVAGVVELGDGAEENGAEGDGEGEAADVPPEVARLVTVVAELDELADLPVSEHVGRYDAVHAELSAALTSIDGV